MRHKCWQWLSVLACACATIAMATASAELPAPLKPFEAEYRVTRGPITLGRAVTRLTEHHTGWQYETITTATGIASILVSGDAIERTLLEPWGDGFRPLHYFQQIPEDDGRSRVLFQWDQLTARVDDADGRREVAITNGLYDPQSALLVLMTALPDHDGDSSGLPGFDIIDDDGDIKHLRFAYRGQHTIQVPFGRYETVRVALVRDDRPKRETIGWFAPDLDWLPIRLEQRDKGSLVARLELTHLNGESPATTRRHSTPPNQQRR